MSVFGRRNNATVTTISTALNIQMISSVRMETDLQRSKIVNENKTENSTLCSNHTGVFTLAWLDLSSGLCRHVQVWLTYLTSYLFVFSHQRELGTSRTFVSKSRTFNYVTSHKSVFSIAQYSFIKVHYIVVTLPLCNIRISHDNYYLIKWAQSIPQCIVKK